MPLIIPRYLLKKFLPIFFLSLLVLIGILMMSRFLRLFGLAVTKGISLFWIAGCFARLLPFILGLALPMAFVIALLLSFGELAQSSEIMALRGCGFSFFGIAWPFLAAAILISGLLLYIDHKAGPEGYHAFKHQYRLAMGHLDHVDLEPRVFLDLGPWKLYADRTDRKSGRIWGAYLIGTFGDQETRVEAPEGRLRIEKGKGIALVFKRGSIFFINPDPEKLTSGRFGTYRLDIPLQVSGGSWVMDIPEMNSRTLLGRLRDPGLDPQQQREYRVELAVRSAQAFSPLAFFLIGAPIGIALKSQGRAKGFALSLGLLFAFYGLMSLGIGVGRRDARWSWAAPWAADAGGFAAGLVLTARALVL